MFLYFFGFKCGFAGQEVGDWPLFRTVFVVSASPLKDCSWLASKRKCRRTVFVRRLKCKPKNGKGVFLPGS